jgi:hypothetical protein
MKSTYKFYINPLFVLGLSMILTPGCKKNDSNQDPVNLKLGTSYQGGIIFSLDATGKHGLIAAIDDQSSTAPWWNGSFISSFITTGATSITDGSANTDAIIQVQGNNGSYAAKVCRDYSGGGFNDWFLPSKDQLNILYGQKTLVGNFSTDIYWSSTESEDGFTWVQYFIDGGQHINSTADLSNFHTRAIRSF